MTVSGDGIGQIFWPGSMNQRGYEALLSAASAGGYRHMAISPLMVSQLKAAGWGDAAIRERAGQAGVALRELDGVSSWAPLWYGADPLPWLKERFDFSAEQCLDFAEGVGAEVILAAAAFDKGALPLDSIVESFAAFCDLAADRGMTVELELVPYWGVPNLSMAWDVVRLADRPNAALLIDSWHLCKGSDDFEGEMALLQTIPGHRIANVQLADALIAPQADNLYAEGRFRLFPGDGELPIPRILSAIEKLGALRWIGTEIFGDAIDRLSSEEAGSRSAAACRSAIETIRPRAGGADRG